LVHIALLTYLLSKFQYSWPVHLFLLCSTVLRTYVLLRHYCLVFYDRTGFYSHFTNYGIVSIKCKMLQSLNMYSMCGNPLLVFNFFKISYENSRNLPLFEKIKNEKYYLNVLNCNQENGNLRFLEWGIQIVWVFRLSITIYEQEVSNLAG
jgi:hypothetical protein